ncbi:oligosaccharide flippase family protein [Polluticaenibacter yanchengensis]|uniref:Oligosaccharide flippase family protein n=1 Tax=Polluticaenibacter yanchengensis TaxID=3014562 RepID=A0ABT4UJG1_9BACT|nr:oligosaccharide flippase family protein [Chitinophagaceae bacterium LY-5]
MSGVKSLASQTMWYGVSSIAARFINYLLTPYLTYNFAKEVYGDITVLYAAIPFLTVLFTHGMETAYFRFSNNQDRRQSVYNTSSLSMILVTALLSVFMLFNTQFFANLLEMGKNPEFIKIAVLIVAFDALSAIPFAKLRQDGRPIKFALVRVGGILVNIFFTYFFISVCPKMLAQNPDSWIRVWYNPTWGVGYVFLANLIQSIVTLLLLGKEFLGFQWRFNPTLWKEMMIYSLPLIIVGFGGIINETFDRLMLMWLAKDGPNMSAKGQVGIYGACYKLSILITLAVQAFKMGAEPFFFKEAGNKNAPQTYARVMKFFVIVLCLMFLGVMLFIDYWKHFIQNREMWAGLGIVPVLLLANMFLGIYYNLSIWYKLGNQTKKGAYITLIGSAITVVFNFIFIPLWGYWACAWATFLCYGSMMVISYVWGQKHYRVPYAWKKLTAYIVIAVVAYLIHFGITSLTGSLVLSTILGMVLLALYAAFIFKIEKAEFKKLPVIGKYIK